MTSNPRPEDLIVSRSDAAAYVVGEGLAIVGIAIFIAVAVLGGPGRVGIGAIVVGMVGIAVANVFIYRTSRRLQPGRIGYGRRYLSLMRISGSMNRVSNIRRAIAILSDRS